MVERIAVRLISAGGGRSPRAGLNRSACGRCPTRLGAGNDLAPTDSGQIKVDVFFSGTGRTKVVPDLYLP